MHLEAHRGRAGEPCQLRLRSRPLPGGAHPASAARPGPPSPFLTLERARAVPRHAGQGSTEALDQKPAGTRGVGAGGRRGAAGPRLAAEGTSFRALSKPAWSGTAMRKQEMAVFCWGGGVRRPLPSPRSGPDMLLSEAELPPQRDFRKTQVWGCFLSV